MKAKNDFASESGHWYEKDGSPRYTIVGKNGKQRKTTIRDAREHGLLPSVTTIMRVLAKPALEQWKMRNVLMSALTLPRRDGESDEDFVARIMRDSGEEGRRAADEGTAIHGAIEAGLAGQYFPAQYREHVENVRKAIGDRPWAAEKSFASPRGYGGKVDLCCPDLVVDVKTKEWDGEPPKAYDEHLMQLAAYRQGLGPEYWRAELANVFVHRKTAEVHVVKHDLVAGLRGIRTFNALHAYWKEANEWH